MNSKKDYNKSYYFENKLDLKFKTISQLDYPLKNRTKSAKYRSNKNKNTPKWAKKQDLKHVYANCKPGYQIDHIVPLKAKFAEGWHVIGNLQQLPISENCAKRNNFEIFITCFFNVQ